jgi:hypothetical protein
VISNSFARSRFPRDRLSPQGSRQILKYRSPPAGASPAIAEVLLHWCFRKSTTTLWEGWRTFSINAKSQRLLWESRHLIFWLPEKSRSLQHPSVPNPEGLETREKTAPKSSAPFAERVGHPPRWSRCNGGLVDSPPSVDETRFDVINLQIRHFLNDLIHAQPGSEQIENIADPDSHSSHARASAALLRVQCDAFKQRFHV